MRQLVEDGHKIQVDDAALHVPVLGLMPKSKASAKNPRSSEAVRPIGGYFKSLVTMVTEFFIASQLNVMF